MYYGANTTLAELVDKLSSKKEVINEMDLVADLKDIMIKNNDKEHNLKVEVDNMGVKVFLDYDPDGNYEEKTMIPIEYTTCEEFAYIPDSEYREKFIVNDYGMDLHEITLIKDIMQYLEDHKEEIGKLCVDYSWEFRK
jgi:hypothetical protein